MRSIAKWGRHKPLLTGLILLVTSLTAFGSHAQTLVKSNEENLKWLTRFSSTKLADFSNCEAYVPSSHMVTQGDDPKTLSEDLTLVLLDGLSDGSNDLSIQSECVAVESLQDCRFHFVFYNQEAPWSRKYFFEFEIAPQGADHPSKDGATEREKQLKSLQCFVVP